MIKSAVKVFSQSIIRLFCSVISLKVISYFSGPAGLLMYGQLQSFMQISSTIASSATSTGVVKYTASNEYNEKSIIVTAFYLALIYCVFMQFLFFAFSSVILGGIIEKKWIYVFFMIPIASFFFAITNLVLSIFNGRANYNQYFYFSIANIGAVFVSTIASVLIAKLHGVMFSIALSPMMSLVLCSFLLKIFNVPFYIPFYVPFNKFNKKLAISLSQYSIMALSSALLVYGTQIYLRHYISVNVDASSAGIWFSATKLSEVYMGIISLLFSTLIVPRYSKGKYKKEIQREVGLCLKIVIPLSILMVLGVNLLASYAVIAIYGQPFMAAAGILKIYAVGDALKIITWTFLYVALIRKQTLIYVSCEMLGSFLYLYLCICFFSKYGLKYMAEGYVVQGAISLLVISLWFYHSKYKGNHDSL